MAPGRVGPSPVPIFSSLLFFLAGLASIYSLELKIGDIVTKQYPPIVNMRCTIPLLSLLPVVVILSSWMTMNLVSAAPLEVDLDVFHHQHAQSESLLHRRQIESGGENVPGGGGTTGGGGDDEIITMTRKELDMYAVLHVNWGTLIQQCVDRKAAESGLRDPIDLKAQMNNWYTSCQKETWPQAVSAMEQLMRGEKPSQSVNIHNRFEMSKVVLEDSDEKRLKKAGMIIPGNLLNGGRMGNGRMGNGKSQQDQDMFDAAVRLVKNPQAGLEGLQANGRAFANAIPGLASSLASNAATAAAAQKKPGMGFKPV